MASYQVKVFSEQSDIATENAANNYLAAHPTYVLVSASLALSGASYRLVIGYQIP